jgi:DNA invertase Pin-like site-specific DNA recombinase
VEILEQLRVLIKEKRAAVVVLYIPLLDTRQKERDLTGTLIADIVLQLLSYVAETEREFIHQRQAEGIAVSKANGVKFGRPPKEVPEAFDSVRKKWARNELSGRKAAQMLNVDRMTFLSWMEKYGNIGE